MKLSVNQSIVDAEGVAQYKMLRDWLQPLGIRNNVVLAYSASATYNTEEALEIAPRDPGEFTTFGNISRDQIKDLLETIERDLRNYPFLDRLVKRYYFRGIRQRLLFNKGVPNPKCVALNAHLRILPDGTIPTCQFNTCSVGSLREQRFSTIWNSSEAEKQRSWVRNCPGCWAECEVIPNTVYSGDLLKDTINPRWISFLLKKLKWSSSPAKLSTCESSVKRESSRL
jgi:hypothetical protein